MAVEEPFLDKGKCGGASGIRSKASIVLDQLSSPSVFLHLLLRLAVNIPLCTPAVAAAAAAGRVN